MVNAIYIEGGLKVRKKTPQYDVKMIVRVSTPEGRMPCAPTRLLYVLTEQ